MNKTPIPAFEIDNRICIMIERELAISLGNLVLETNTNNTALLALAHQLRKLSPDKMAKSPEPSLS